MTNMEIKAIINTMFAVELQNLKMLLTIKELLKNNNLFSEEEYLAVYRQVSAAKAITDAETLVNMLTIDSINKDNPA